MRTLLRSLSRGTVAVAALVSLAACGGGGDATGPTQPPPPTTGTLIVSADQASCTGQVTAEIFINGAGQGRFQLNVNTRQTYSLPPGRHTVTSQINGIPVGLPVEIIITPGAIASYLFFCR